MGPKAAGWVASSVLSVRGHIASLAEDVESQRRISDGPRSFWVSGCEHRGKPLVSPVGANNRTEASVLVSAPGNHLYIHTYLPAYGTGDYNRLPLIFHHDFFASFYPTFYETEWPSSGFSPWIKSLLIARQYVSIRVPFLVPLLFTPCIVGRVVQEPVSKPGGSTKFSTTQRALYSCSSRPAQAMYP